MTHRRAVVIGASIGGVTAAESLRSMGYPGKIVLVEAQAGNPYQRPPLSKTILAGAPASAIEIATASSLASRGVRLCAGVRAERLDTGARTIDLGDERLAYTDLIIATGADPIVPFPSSSIRLTTLRNYADARRMTAALVADASVVVIGGGVLGSEVATAARRRNCEVVLISDRPGLRLGPLADRHSDRLVATHRGAGVDVRLGARVRDVRDGVDKAIVTMVDGDVHVADLVVVAAGVRPNVTWLDGALPLVSGALRCTAWGRVAPDVWALGDVARWVDEPVGFRGTQGAAIDQARLVAADVVSQPRPQTLSPYFWADVHGVRIQAAGEFPSEAEIDLTLATEGPGFCESFIVDSEVVGALGWAAPREFVRARRSLGRTVVARQELVS